jgi:hypothetical protein
MRTTNDKFIVSHNAGRFMEYFLGEMLTGKQPTLTDSDADGSTSRGKRLEEGCIIIDTGLDKPGGRHA